jgi:hypothetical protein
MSVTAELVRDGATTSNNTGGTGRQLATPFEDLVTTLLGTCFVGGLLSDAWAHTNIIKTLDSFFTPWHALLYSGFAATAAWTFWLGFRRRSGVSRWWRNAWPAGYALGALGGALFLVAGFGDMVWHIIFGIEKTLDAALSPTHLLLAFGGTLLVTSPLRSWWADRSGPRRAATGIVSLALGVIIAHVLVAFGTALTSLAPTEVYDRVMNSPSHIDAAYGMTRYLVTTVIFGIPVLLVYRRRATFGTATAVVGAVALFEMVQNEAPKTLTVAAFGAVLGALATDLILVRLDAVRGPDALLRLPIAGAVFAALVWSGHLIGMALADHVRWQIELWAGAVVLTAIVGALLGGLAERPAVGARART